MIGYAEREVFSERERAIRHHAAMMVAHLNEPDGAPVRCHELTRVVSRELAERLGVALMVQDGDYGGVDHSWIVLRGPGGDGGGIVLDCYAVGRSPMVQLVDLNAPTLQRRLYRVGALRRDIDAAQIDVLRRQLVAFTLTDPAEEDI